LDVDLNTLLVALMFVTVLSMGIGNILVSLADIFNNATPSRRDRVHVAWIILVLLVHFNLFWHTKEILNVEDWQFGGFLLAVAGPVLLFFATSIMLTEPPADVKPDQATFFFGLARRFFLMFAIVQGWVVLVGYNLSGAFITQDFTNIAFGLLALFLAFSSKAQVHNLGVWIAWALVLTSGAIRWLGI
jgi:hypothetical protein